MRPSVDAMMPRARVPVGLRMADAAIMAASLFWGCCIVNTFRSADALASCLAHGAALLSVLSPRFSFEAHPQAWGMSWRAWPQLSSLALAVAFAAELLWSRLATGAFILPPQPAFLSLLPSGGKGLVLHRHIIAPLLVTAYKVRRPCMRLASYAMGR